MSTQPGATSDQPLRSRSHRTLSGHTGGSQRTPEARIAGRGFWSLRDCENCTSSAIAAAPAADCSSGGGLSVDHASAIRRRFDAAHFSKPRSRRAPVGGPFSPRSSSVTWQAHVPLQRLGVQPCLCMSSRSRWPSWSGTCVRQRRQVRRTVTPKCNHPHASCARTAGADAATSSETQRRNNCVSCAGVPVQD